MKKLKLEELQVESFDTCSASEQLRGTVAGHAKPVPPESRIGPCYPTDPNFDCTYGCSRESACPDNCIIYSDFDCTTTG